MKGCGHTNYSWSAAGKIQNGMQVTSLHLDVGECMRVCVRAYMCMRACVGWFCCRECRSESDRWRLEGGHKGAPRWMCHARSIHYESRARYLPSYLRIFWATVVAQKFANHMVNRWVRASLVPASHHYQQHGHHRPAIHDSHQANMLPTHSPGNQYLSLQIHILNN